MTGQDDVKPGPAAGPPPGEPPSREERLAARLRDNLKRRKEQARARRQDDGSNAG